jgi:hypothetical protein
MQSGLPGLEVQFDELKAGLNSIAEELIVTEIISPHKISMELPTESPAADEKLGVFSTMFPQVWPEEDRQNRIEFTDRRLTVDATERRSCHPQDALEAGGESSFDTNQPVGVAAKESCPGA